MANPTTRKKIFSYVFGKVPDKTTFEFPEVKPHQFFIQKYGYPVARLMTLVQPSSEITGKFTWNLLNKVCTLIKKEQERIQRNLSRGIQPNVTKDLRKPQGICNLAMLLLQKLDCLAMDYAIHFDIDFESKELINLRSQIVLIGFFVTGHCIDFAYERSLLLCEIILIRDDSWIVLDERVWYYYSFMTKYVKESERDVKERDDHDWDLYDKEINYIVNNCIDADVEYYRDVMEM